MYAFIHCTVTAICSYERARVHYLIDTCSIASAMKDSEWLFKCTKCTFQGLSRILRVLFRCDNLEDAYRETLSVNWW